MNRKPLIKTMQWLLASTLLASILASHSIAFAANCAGVLGHHSIEQYTD